MKHDLYTVIYINNIIFRVDGMAVLINKWNAVYTVVCNILYIIRARYNYKVE